MIDTLEKIKAQIKGNALMLYMKGTPQFPQCGFSSQVVQILKLSKAKFAYVNIFRKSRYSSNASSICGLVNFPQLYLKGELIGGCDIVTELYEQGELQKQLQEAGVTGEAMEIVACS